MADKYFFTTAVLILVALVCTDSLLAKESAPTFFPTRLPVKPFPGNDDWINTSEAITLGQLHGKFVLLDFWTLGCINCMHLIPELKKIEAAWPKQLVVIGVHSGKFAEEKDTKNIEQAVFRYGVEHPVVNDADFAIWNNFGIQAWPSLVLIDPQGYAVWAHSGEISFAQLNDVLKPAINYYRKAGLLDEQPIRLHTSPRHASNAMLRFPGKVLADESSNRLFIADSGHNRILIVRFDGSVLATVGEGHRGAADGAFDKAQFNAPQGMALKDELLYVADTGNHLIRKVDLKQRAVFTIAGNGRQAFKPLSSTARPKPRKTALNSPWDLYIHGGNIFIAMAGSHQIWKMPLDESSIELFAGNGVEDIVDGRLLPNLPYQRGVASFAQPSGLTSDGLWLYVADAEGSSIRALPFNPKKFVRTIVGTARLPRSRLFTFGDTDGPPSQARLQHPLGIAYADGKLYIADTYNNKIKTIDRLTAETKTIAGDGTIGDSDKPPKFNNPSGLSWAVGKLFVADTNNHSIRVIEPRRGNKVSTLLK